MSSPTNPKTKLLAYEIITLLVLGLAIGTIFDHFGKPIAAETAVTLLGSIAEISATILSIFFAAALLLVERSPAATRKIMTKGDFLSGSFLFTLAILHSLISILTIEPDTLIDLRTQNADFLVIMPLMWMIFAIIVVGFFIWRLMSKEPQTSQEE